jgi:hypothetical protein
MVQGIVQQQAQIRADAANLERLQSQAGSADGQMKAMMPGSNIRRWLAASMQTSSSKP